MRWPAVRQPEFNSRLGTPRRFSPTEHSSNEENGDWTKYSLFPWSNPQHTAWMHTWLFFYPGLLANSLRGYISVCDVARPLPLPPLQAAACPTTVTSRGGQGGGRGGGLVWLASARLMASIYALTLPSSQGMTPQTRSRHKQLALAASTSSYNSN